MELQRLMRRAEDFNAEVALEYYRNLAGLSEDFRLVEIVGRYPELFARTTYDAVMALQPDGIDERELKLLRYFLTTNLFTAELKQLIEEKEKVEAALTVEHEGEQIPYRSVPLRNANQPDAVLRRELDCSAVEALETRLNPLYQRIFTRTFELTQELGYPDYTTLTQELAELRLEWLRELMLSFLRETAELYRSLLADYARKELRLSLDELEQCDIGRLFRAEAFDPLFPQERMLPALVETLAGLGIDLERQPNVALDLERRPRKTPRAFCIGVRVPQDVRLVLTPIGGQADYSTLFHEAGHLEFYAHMEPSLPFLYRHEGDTSVHECFAFLLQYLTTDPVWLADMLGAREAGEYVRFTRFNKLYLLRRYAAKLDYEYRFWRRLNLKAARQAYSETLTGALIFRCAAARALADFDEGYYVAKYLQAWLAEASLRLRLRTEFGEDWYRRRAAGDLLRQLWREGQKYSLQELLGQLNLPPLSYQPVLDDIRLHTA